MQTIPKMLYIRIKIEVRNKVLTLSRLKTSPHNRGTIYKVHCSTSLISDLSLRPQWMKQWNDSSYKGQAYYVTKLLMFTEHTNPNRFVEFHWCILCKHTFIDTLDWHGSWSISILVFAPTSKAFILALSLPFIGQRTLLLVSSGIRWQ